MIKRNSYYKRRAAARARLLRAAFFSLAFVGGFALLFSSGATRGASWRFSFDSFPFSPFARKADKRPRRYLDAAGRLVYSDGTVAPSSEESSTVAVESTEILSNDVPTLEPERPIGATFDEAAPELAPVSFANNDPADASNLESVGWFVDEAAEKREEWANALRCRAFPEPAFANASSPTWNDDVAVEPATSQELSALAFDPNVGSSSLVSSTLRARAAIAQPLVDDQAFAHTASDASAPPAPIVAPPTPPVAPTRVGVFTASGAFDAYGSAQVRVK